MDNSNSVTRLERFQMCSNGIECIVMSLNLFEFVWVFECSRLFECVRMAGMSALKSVRPLMYSWRIGTAIVTRIECIHFIYVTSHSACSENRRWGIMALRDPWPLENPPSGSGLQRIKGEQPESGANLMRGHLVLTVCFFSTQKNTHGPMSLLLLSFFFSCLGTAGLLWPQSHYKLLNLFRSQITHISIIIETF